MFSKPTALPDTAYLYRIIAMGGETEDGVGGLDTASVPSKTRSVRTAPLPVDEFQALEIAPRHVTLAWDETDGAIRYTVQRYDGKTWRNAGSTKSNEITVRSLKAETDYQFRVVAVGKDGNSEPGPALNIATPFDVPDTPGALRVYAVDSDSAALTWKASSGSDFYRVYRYNTSVRGPESWTLVADAITETSFIDANLTAGTKYRYKVLGVNDSGESRRAATSGVTTLRPSVGSPPPNSLELVNATKSSVKISFAAEEEGRGTYRVQWSTDGEHWFSQKTFTTAQGAVVVTGLNSATDYVFRIRVEKAKNISEWSDEFRCSTLHSTLYSTP